MYDYKGAHAPEAGRWARERSFQVPLYMRAVESLPGVHAVGGFYQPLAGRDLRARGGLELEAALQLDCVRGDDRASRPSCGRWWRRRSPRRARRPPRRVGGAAGTPADLWLRGQRCMYPTICRCER